MTHHAQGTAIAASPKKNPGGAVRLWRRGNWAIYADGYVVNEKTGLSYSGILYDDGRAAFDFPERIPETVKAVFRKLRKVGPRQYVMPGGDFPINLDPTKAEMQDVVRRLTRGRKKNPAGSHVVILTAPNEDTAATAANVVSRVEQYAGLTAQQRGAKVFLYGTEPLLARAVPTLTAKYYLSSSRTAINRNVNPKGATYVSCPHCEAGFKGTDVKDGKIPPHRWMGKPCPGAGTPVLKNPPKRKNPRGLTRRVPGRTVRRRRNPVMGILGNPPYGDQPSNVLGSVTYIEYTHGFDREPYKHTFRPAAVAILSQDGKSLKITRKDGKRLWKLYEV